MRLDKLSKLDSQPVLCCCISIYKIWCNIREESYFLSLIVLESQSVRLIGCVDSVTMQG